MKRQRFVFDTGLCFNVSPYFLRNHFKADYVKNFVLLDKALYEDESWDLVLRRWSKLVKDFARQPATTDGNVKFDISKIPDIYDCAKYDLQHNMSIINFPYMEQLYVKAKYMADVVVPQVSITFVYILQ